MGALAGIRVVEFAGLGPAPFCCMLLADMGADILCVDRPDAARGGFPRPPRYDLVRRGRPGAAIDLKHPDGVALARRLVAGADVLVEGFRPGVMERLGLGPEPCLADNPRLVYARMTGWGQDGPLAHAAGHDLNYIALAGVAGAIGPPEGAPVPPLNLVGDYGGGALYLAVGILAALIERARSGRGQVVDAAIVDGTASLATIVFGLRAAGLWQDARGVNTLDGGAPFYRAYETADRRWITVAAIEPQFYAELLDRLGLADADLPGQWDRAGWPLLHARFAAAVAAATLAEWQARLEGSDVCYAPVLGLDEAAAHPHNRARGTFLVVDGVTQPAPAPRFSRTPSAVPAPPRAPGADTEAALAAWGVPAGEIAALRAAGTIGTR